MTKSVVSERVKRVVMYAFLIIMSFISVFPLYWCFISAFNTTQEVLGGKLIPGGHLVENIQNLMAQQQVFTALKNSFINTILVVLLSLTCCSLAGYGFEIYHDKWKDRVLGILMLSMMVPFVALMVPMFQMFSAMGLLNKYIGFVLPSISTPFLIMLFRSNARTFPKEIIEAARMVASGHTVLDQKVMNVLHRSTRSLGSDTGSDDPRRAKFREQYLKLTEREREICRLIQDGRSNREIASVLHITEGTVKNYLSSIYGALGVRDRTALAVALTRTSRSDE